MSNYCFWRNFKFIQCWIHYMRWSGLVSTWQVDIWLLCKNINKELHDYWHHMQDKNGIVMMNSQTRFAWYLEAEPLNTSLCHLSVIVILWRRHLYYSASTACILAFFHCVDFKTTTLCAPSSSSWGMVACFAKVQASSCMGPVTGPWA